MKSTMSLNVSYNVISGPLYLHNAIIFKDESYLTEKGKLELKSFKEKLFRYYGFDVTVIGILPPVDNNIILCNKPIPINYSVTYIVQNTCGEMNLTFSDT